jgi:hypothetical protein
LYSLPQSLIEALAKEGHGVLDAEELDFELELACAAEPHHAIGFSGGHPLRSHLFEPRRPMAVSAADCEALGWAEYGLTSAQANGLAIEIESRAASFREQLKAYAGWLITNPLFLREVSVLRRHHPDPVQAAPGPVVYSHDETMLTFLGKWQLARLATWDLPEPQGPNFSGIPLPAAGRRPMETISLELPMTVRLPGRYPIREQISEIRSADSQPHLAEWQDILSQEKRSDKFGIERYAQMLQLQFFRNVVLASRYEQRFHRCVARLDRAFASYLKSEQQSVQRLRLKARRRLRSPGDSAGEGM